MFSKVQYFCLFIGYPRSGSSLVGALLDAHPNIVVAHEFDVLAQIERQSFSRESLFSAICDLARDQGVNGRHQDNYPYAVEGGWQGRHETIHVIGDKKAARTAMRCHKNPECLAALNEITKTQTKFIHCVRHPLDNLATVVLKDGALLNRSPLEYRLQVAIRYYFDVCTAAVVHVRSTVPRDCWLTVHHNDLLSSPQDTLRRLFGFFDQSATDDLLNACARVVWPSPRRTRDLLPWPPAVLETVRQRCCEYDFLNRYRDSITETRVCSPQ